MDDLKKILSVLEVIDKRLKNLEKVNMPNTTGLKSQESKKKSNSLSDYIIDLRENDFFSQPKTTDEVHSELSKDYSCEKDRVSMALLRLSKKRELRNITKLINNKKYKAYAW